jgi:VWFA-related protein
MKRRSVLVSTGLLVAIPVMAALAQAPIFRAGTRLVVLHATVTNAQSELVTNLEQSAFVVFENGKRQPITLFRRDDVPVSVGLLIDNSGSMRTLRSKLEEAALTFARASNPDDEMFVLNFADTPHLDVPMTRDVHQLEAGIARTDSIGGTALRDAIGQAEIYLREHSTRDRRVVVVISDGYDNASSTSVVQIRQQAQQTDMVVDAIGLVIADGAHAGAGRHALEELCNTTGGVAYFPATIEEIDAVALKLAHQIRSQYTIAYAPLNQALDGSYRTIRVTVSSHEHVSVRTRPGYRAVAE